MRPAHSTCVLCGLPAGLFVALFGASSAARAQLEVESQGQLGIESRVFAPDGESRTDAGNVALAGRLQADAELDHVEGRARAFLRLDPYDRARSRVVPEEIWLQGELEPLRLRVGYQMLNWTATEAFHPADVVNSRIQDGSFENPEKLGEPIAALRVEIPMGNVELFLMPVFTPPVLPSARSPLNFAGPGNALGEPRVVERDGDVDDQRFQPQGGAQVQQTWGDVDVAVHVLHHIDREAPLIGIDPPSFTLRPVYAAVTQAGLTYQHALDGTLLKLEGAYRAYRRPGAGAPLMFVTGTARDHALLAAGVEHGISAPDGSELSLLLEGQVLIPAEDDFPEQLEPLFQHDVLIGLRQAFADEQSTTLLTTLIVDVEHPEQLIVSASLSRRLGETWSGVVGLRLLRVPPKNPFAPLAFENLNDQHQLYLNLTRYF